MGFFKDFKDDLSQTVDELAGESAGKAKAGSTDDFLQDLMNGANAAAAGVGIPDPMGG